MNAIDAPVRAVVIDGNDSERAALIALCRQVGIDIQGWAAGGAAGLDLIASLPVPPDLAIIDLALPDIDGADLLQALSMLELKLGIVVSGAGCDRLRDAALTLAEALGLTPLAALDKPPRAEALRSAANAWTRRPGGPAAPAATWPMPDPGQVLQGLGSRQFELHYQPKIALRGGRLRGAEALLRWRHPAHGVLPPCAFLPQTEAAGLVDVLTMEVLRLALADWRRWRAAGMPLPLSINLSPLSLGDPRLAEQLIAAVAEAGMPPSALTFEIVEHVAIADMASALRILIKLRLRGFGLSLDDYGAGHASMLHLTRLPFSELKLDRQLVHGAWRRPHLWPLLRNTIASARAIGVTTVAEGIETEQDWRLMRELGCDMAQGYLIARPMPAAALLAWQAPCPP
jgi:EAL domain-containing protein (putative c-di-GMP-specific phosphodiesterase class I)